MNELPDRPPTRTPASPPTRTPASTTTRTPSEAQPGQLSEPTARAPRRGGRVLVALYFTAYALAVTWPGMLLANRIEPLVLGLPFNLVWVAAWVVGGALVLGWLDYGERR